MIYLRLFTVKSRVMNDAAIAIGEATHHGAIFSISHKEITKGTMARSIIAVSMMTMPKPLFGNVIFMLFNRYRAFDNLQMQPHFYPFSLVLIVSFY